MAGGVVLNERAQHLLKVLVERYVTDGNPVGSRTLAREAGLDLSPATIRNVMADLEDMGLVVSPHTSAGRIPTVTGYRLFVDHLLTVKKLQAGEVRRLEKQLEPGASTKELLESASDLLSGFTRMAGVVTLPRVAEPSLRQVEFLPLSDNRVLAILVINEREVENRIVHTRRLYSAAELQQAANYLNQAFAGHGIQGVRQRLLQEMREAQDGMNAMMRAVIEMAQTVFQTDDEREDCIIAGETNLMTFEELSDVQKLRQLFEAFNQKRDILHLLDQSINADGIQIFIGSESGYTPLDNCSVITSSYDVEGTVAGVLGVIGPTRMAYEKVIPIVDMTAKLLGAALNQR